MAAMEETVQVSRRYLQLKLGNVVTGAYLQYIGRSETDRHWECTSRAEMETRHQLFDCSTSTSELRKMLKKCEKDGGGQLRTVKQLLSLRRAIPAFPDFMATTQVSQ